MKYLIAGLGNIGDEYKNTRHNIGFDVVEFIASKNNCAFSSDRLAFKTEFKLKGRTVILIKPTTYMNLSGKAINYWLQKEKIEISNLFVVVDDLALPFGSIRIKSKGSDGGHNGLKNINEVLQHPNFARLRFGIGNEYMKGKQVDYVLGKWTDEESQKLKERIETINKAIETFILTGIDKTMSGFNNK